MASMSKRKRDVDGGFSIEGLTKKIVDDAAASYSYERGEELMSSAIIESHSNAVVEASISGKDYEIEIAYNSPVRNEYDLNYNCSCPDDRDGCCKHICAVLLKLVDQRPASKKARNSGSKATKNKNVAKKYSASELKHALDGFTKEDLVEIVNEALDLKSVQKIVASKLDAKCEQQVDIGSYKARIYEAVHQLDRLRPSAQFSMQGRVHADLGSIIHDARKYHRVGNNTVAMQILMAIGKSISNERNIAGEVWKRIHSGGGIDYDVASLMKEIVEGDEQMAGNENLYDQVEEIATQLAAYGVDAYSEVLECFDFE